MDNKRSTKNQPFCWQEKKILRLLRCQYEGKEHDKLRNLYLTLTEIYSDFNGQDIKYYTQTIIKYSSLGKDWIPKGLKIFESLKVIQLVEERSKGKFKDGSDFDILVAHKNEHSIGLNTKYTLELENGILFDVKGTYAVERDSHNNSGKNKNKGEWIVGTGLGYKF